MSDFDYLTAASVGLAPIPYEEETGAVAAAAAAAALAAARTAASRDRSMINDQQQLVVGLRDV